MQTPYTTDSTVPQFSIPTAWHEALNLYTSKTTQEMHSWDIRRMPYEPLILELLFEGRVLVRYQPTGECDIEIEPNIPDARYYKAASCVTLAFMRAGLNRAQRAV